MKYAFRRSPPPLTSLGVPSEGVRSPLHDSDSEPSSSHLAKVWSAPVWLMLALCCALPIIWLLAQVVTHPGAVLIPWRDGSAGRLMLRTLGYNAAVGLIAVALALPAAQALGRGRGWLAKLLWLVVPLPTLLPSIVYAYGWNQCIRLASPWLGEALMRLPAGVQSALSSIGVGFETIGQANGPPLHRLFLELTSPADVARCVLTLAAWLWPLPAILIGLSLRRLDPEVQQAALLDGALSRVTARQLAGPLAAAFICVTILATQEFAIYEPTGISVVATEVRMLFQTGFVSSPSNPITGPMGAASPTAGLAFTDQPARAAAAVAAAVPLVAIIFALGALAFWLAGRLSAAQEVEQAAWPSVLNAGWVSKGVAILVSAVTLGAPIFGMVAAHRRAFDPNLIWTQSGPEIMGSIALATLAGGCGLVVAFCAVVRPARFGLPLALASFLVGGQLVAIAMIRLYNRPSMGWIYDAPPIMAMAYLSRFGWLALLAAGATFGKAWRALRDMAALDGAGPTRTALHVVWPLAWPTLAASALAIVVLSLTETPATVLISPLRPEPVVPKLMTWVHILENDPMIEASLLLALVSLALGLATTGLVALGVWLWRGRGRRAMLSGLLVGLLAFTLPGCGDPAKPLDVWCDTGTGPAQLVYPRAIAYRPQDDSFVVIDRMARVQRLDRSGKFINEWRMPDFHTGKPVGVSVGPDGNIYIPDTHYHRVVVYSPDGKELRRWGNAGTKPGEFIYPTDIAFDEKGHVFVAEYGDHDRIQVFDVNGKYLYEFGSFGDQPGQFSRPQSMVIDAGLVYIADACNHRLVVFTTDGKFVRTMGSVGSAPGQFRFPYGLEEDREGRLIVCEFGNNRVQRIDKATGHCLGVWGGPGHEPGRLAYPWAAAVDKRDRVVTVDSGNNRLQVFAF